MFKRNAMGNTRTKIIAGAVMLAIGLSAAGAAMSTDVFGGGATLPAGAYVGFNFNGVSPIAKLSTNATTNHLDPTSPLPVVGVSSGSLFGAWAATSGNHVSFCQTGSGNGKKIFDNTDGASPAHALTATDFCTGNAFVAPSSTSGFGASLATTVNPHFAASDAPMSQSEYGWFFSPGNKTTKYTQPVQFPAVVGSVAIVLNNANITTQVNLTDTQLCGVYNGSISTWSGLGLPASPAPNGDNLNVVFRSDGSGTSFSLSNHLAAVCGGVAGSPHLIADQAFTNVVGQFFTSGLPARFIGANGNSGVIATAAATNGSIAYAESANFKNVSAANPSLSATKVNGFDPFADLPNAITLATVNDRGITGVDAGTGRPVTGVLTPITQAGCMNLVEPSTYATSTTRYPIVAVSYLIANNTGNGADLAAVQGLVGSAYGAHTGVTTIGTGTGYAFATVLPTVSAKVNTCIKA
jgi:ABC-type phosphate transport system substrate-binding protein